MCGPNGHFHDDETTVVEFADDNGLNFGGVQTVQASLVGPSSYDDFEAQGNAVLDDAGLTNPTDRSTTLWIAGTIKQTLAKWIGNAPADVIAQVGSVDKLGLTVVKLLALSLRANINGVNHTSVPGVLN